MNNHLYKTNRPLATLAILMCLAIASLEVTVVATAMPRITAELQGFDKYAWVTSIYLLLCTVCIPIFGKLGDLYPRRSVLISAIFIFLIGSTLCGFAGSMDQLIFFRAIQGIGAGGLQSVAFAISADLYTPRERARIQGVFGATWAVSALLGSVLGGVIVSKFSWGWIFLMNIPLGLISLCLLFFFLHEKPKEKQIVILDIKGAFLLSTSILSLLLAAESRWLFFTIPIFLISVFLFFLVEKKAQNPILSFELMRHRLIRIAMILGTLMGALMMSTLTYLSLFLQAVLFYPATQAGAFLIPVMISWPLAATITGFILPKTGYRPLIVLGLLISLLSIGIFPSFIFWNHLAFPMWLLKLALLGFGTGLGMANTALIISIQEKAPLEHKSVAIASISFSRSIGSAIGVGALGGVLKLALGAKIPAHLLDQILDQRTRNLMEMSLLRQVSKELTHGLLSVFLIIVVLALISWIFALGFPKVQMEDKRERMIR